MNETQIGLTLPVFEIELTRVRISKPKLRKVVLEAQMYDPERAVKLSFLDKVVEPDQGRPLRRIASQLASYPADTDAKNSTAVLTEAIKAIRSSIGR